MTSQKLLLLPFFYPHRRQRGRFAPHFHSKKKKNKKKSCKIAYKQVLTKQQPKNEFDQME